MKIESGVFACDRLCSYRQTIQAYPNRGGSYTVASENLGAGAGLLAAAALMIDYILTAAVPSLQPRPVVLCLGSLVTLTVVNLRGVAKREVCSCYPRMCSS